MPAYLDCVIYVLIRLSIPQGRNGLFIGLYGAENTTRAQ